MRVSEVLDHLKEPWYYKWLRKVGFEEADRISNEALRVGSIIDQAIQDDAYGRERSYSGTEEEVLNCLAGWDKFKSDRPDIFKLIVKYRDNMQKELQLDDLTAHPDFFCTTLLLDFKTGHSTKYPLNVKKDHRIQTAIYTRIVNKTLRMNITHNGILIFDKSKAGNYLYETPWGEPFITFWQSKFQARYEAYKEDEEFKEMVRKKLEEERLA